MFRCEDDRAIVTQLAGVDKLAQQGIDRATEKGAGTVGQQRHALATPQVEQRATLRIHCANWQHLAVGQMQGGEDIRVQLQRGVGIVIGQHEVAGAFAQGVPEMIIVLPDSKTRHLGSLYASSPTVGDFENFIAGDLIEYIDSHYRTIARPESRGLVGHSMGGYGAARIGIKHAEKFGALYIMSPGGLSPGGFGGPQSAETMALMESVRTVEDYEKLQGIQRGQFAIAAAYSPNPAKPPFYLDLPYENGKVRPGIMAKWNANAPLAFLDQYVGKVKNYRGIAIEIGDKDGPGTDPRALHEALNKWGIENSFTLYDGDHTNRLGFRMQDHVLPFFGKHLASDPAE